MTESQADLPVIDYAVLTATDPEGNRTPSALTECHRLFTALRDTGFTYLQYPGSTTNDTINTLFDLSQRFFSKPLTEKLRIVGHIDKGRGPSQGYSNPQHLATDTASSDLKEYFGMYRDDDTDRPNQWLPDANSQALRAGLVRFFDSCHEVVVSLLAALSEEIGIPPDALRPFLDDRNHFVACLRYPAVGADAFATRTRAAPHTDYGCLTLLFNDEAGGLQVRRGDGEWRYVPRREGCAVLNVGDLLSRLFNGLLPSTMHRVVEPPVIRDNHAPDRYSIAFFAHFNADLLVKPLEALVSETHPARFEPVVAGEHVKARVRQLHLAGNSLREEKTVAHA
ncbi:putative oxidoreductase [Aspergillus taichungensis]|uniref:Putative oxidoreductase n=1 Tax=Aspergillus taichungensis TaxID=482145 RepID=A0A2J5I8K5_9EURO|nr:putative oxidoreductase [Aspergillus taichungensis]